MKTELNVVNLQCELMWEDPAGNRSAIAKEIKNLPQSTDVIVLPEMFTSGFSMDTSGAEKDSSQTTVNWMKELAIELDSAITGSIKVEDNGQYYNRLYWVDPNQVLQYDKRHLFSFAGEDECFTAGEELLILNYKGWRVCPLICYDLRFPKWSRNLDREGKSKFDLLVYVANWPAVRSAPWSILLRARAIENQVFLIGCNRVGEDNNGIAYSGDSCILDAKGGELAVTKPGEIAALSATLKWSELEDFRKKFPILSDGDKDL